MIGDSLLNSVQVPMVLSLRFISSFNCKLALANALKLSELCKLSLHKFVVDFTTGKTWLSETVTRADSPIVYWWILLSWVAFSAGLIAMDFFT